MTGILAREYPGAQTAYPADDLAHPAAAYGGPRDAFFIAEWRGRVAGTCAVKAEGPATALLRRLFVDAACRGRGVGSHLLEAALTHCRAEGFRTVRIRTSDRMVAAIRACRAKGFHEDERLQLGPVQLVRMTLRM